MADDLIRFQAPLLPDLASVQRYFESSQRARHYTNFGPCHELLVERLEAYLGEGISCVPVANATLGLIVALAALTGSPRTGEVLIPSFTFAAVIEAVRWVGLEPVFVDVEPESWHLDPGALEAALRARCGRVVAVVAASTFGTPPPIAVRSQWEQAADAAGVPLLIDSAAGFGATDGDGVRLGAQGDAEVFSFHATKPFAVGEGGLITTRRRALADRLRRLTNFGFDGRVVSDEGGINAKLAEWPAATALAVLEGFDGVVEARRTHARRLIAGVRDAGFVGQSGAEGSVWQFVPVLAPGPDVREEVLAKAAEARIELRTYFSVPLHRMQPFASLPVAGDLRCTEDLAARILSLPMANDLGDAAIDAIVAALLAAAGFSR
jgi:dTDP-4-amino-4,6-dideoxygalactose transaminase